MEYIEREKAIHAARYTTPMMPSQSLAIVNAIESIPAADVRPVVLCRDCKYWFNAPAADGFNSCERDALIRREDFFCAAGEKREEN